MGATRAVEVAAWAERKAELGPGREAEDPLRSPIGTAGWGV